MSERPFCRKSRGFTLIEVLVAIALTAAVLPLVMQGFSVGLALASAARERSEAAALADSKINELVATSEWQLGLLSGDFGPDRPNYKWKAELKNWDSSTLLELDVHVIWIARGQTHEVVVSTLVDQGQ